MVRAASSLIALLKLAVIIIKRDQSTHAAFFSMHVLPVTLLPHAAFEGFHTQNFYFYTV